MRKCKTKYCKRKTSKGPLCSTCRVKAWRKANPIKYAYQTTKDNAKRRGKPFNITLQDFTEFCIEENYIAGKGKSKTSFSIDCIVNALGYTKGNLQKLSLSENSRKGSKMLVYDWQTKTAYYYKVPPDLSPNYF